jgi:Protein of Unknown function (DUF2784)
LCESVEMKGRDGSNPTLSAAQSSQTTAVIKAAFICASAVQPRHPRRSRRNSPMYETGYAHDFIGYWLDWLIFYDAPSWVFTAVYLTFGMLVLSTLWLAPVRWPPRRRTHNLARTRSD